MKKLIQQIINELIEFRDQFVGQEDTITRIEVLEAIDVKVNIEICNYKYEEETNSASYSRKLTVIAIDCESYPNIEKALRHEFL